MDLDWKEIGTGLVVGIVGGITVFRKMQLSWISDGGNITAIETMETLVKNLRSEIDRLQSENTILRTELHDLRNAVEKLKRIVERRQAVDEQL